MSLFRFRRWLGRADVKEGFDNLPSGICFADNNGTVILCNRQMSRLCHIIMETDLQHIFELRYALNQPKSGVRIVDKDAYIYCFPSNRFWQFAESSVLDADGNVYTQVQAIDVTELHEKSTELATENKALEEANARAKRLYADIDRNVRERETLAMKMRVHDDMGLCLLASRNLLVQDSTLEDYAKCTQRWKKVLDIISVADRSNSRENVCNAYSALDELISASADIGVKVIVEGTLPRSEELAYLMIAAMRECATNTVRHADGSEMTVNIIHTYMADTVRITNNGKKPEGKIIEGTGLSGLRRSVENYGGKMLVESVPEFRLIVMFPRKEKPYDKRTFG